MKLNQYQHAEPNECGSCQHFRPRDPGDGYGLCTFRLPPFAAMRPYVGEERDSDCNERTVSDTDGCSLYEARNLAGDPTEFIQERVWRAGMPSR